MSTTAIEAPPAQIKGPIMAGPTPYVACGPCSLEVLQDWEKNGKKAQVVEDPKTKVRSFVSGDPRPNIRGIRKSLMRKHLREVHGVDPQGQPIRFRARRQGCEHAFVKSQKCSRCGVTQRDITGRVKR